MALMDYDELVRRNRRETIKKSDDYRAPATEGEERADTDYERKFRQSIRISGEVERRLQQIASEEAKAFTTGDEARLGKLAIEADELRDALVRLHAARQGSAFAKLEAAGAASLRKNEELLQHRDDDLVDDSADDVLSKRDGELKKGVDLSDPLGLNASAFGVQNTGREEW